MNDRSPGLTREANNLNPFGIRDYFFFIVYYLYFVVTALNFQILILYKKLLAIDMHFSKLIKD